jgi:hypothetical protein
VLRRIRIRPGPSRLALAWQFAHEGGLVHRAMYVNAPLQSGVQPGGTFDEGVLSDGADVDWLHTLDRTSATGWGVCFSIFRYALFAFRCFCCVVVVRFYISAHVSSPLPQVVRLGDLFVIVFMCFC